MKKSKEHFTDRLLGEEKSIFTPQKQSKAAILIILLKFVKVIIRQLWPVLLVLFFNRKGNFDVWLLMIFGGISLFSLVVSIVAYFKYYYFVEGGELNVKKGVFRKTNLNVPFERIQSIDFEQNIVHQIFNVVSVKIDTAGSAASELSIDAISKSRAEELRGYILRQQDELKSKGVEISGTEGGDTEFAEEKRLVLSLKPMDLLKVGVSQNHLRTAGIILAFAFTIGSELESLWSIDLYDEIESRGGSLISMGFIFTIIFAFVFIFISFLITLVRTIFVYFDLKFWMTGNGFKVVSGLITRKEKSMQKKKLQILSWSRNPLQKIFGIFRLALYQASSMDVLGQKTMIVPGAYMHQIEETKHAVMPGTRDAVFERHGIHPLGRLRFIWFFGVLPSIGIAIFAYFNENPQFWLLLLWLPLAIYMGHQYYLKRGLQVHENYFISEGGIFGRSYKLIEIFKIQAVSITQGWYETRKNLGTLHIYTAAGDLKVPYVPLQKIEQLKDYILFRVESSRREWM